MDVRERVAQRLYANEGLHMPWDQLPETVQDSYRNEADEIIVLVHDPEGDVHNIVLARLTEAERHASPPWIASKLKALHTELMWSRGAVGGAWGHRVARALLGLP